MKREAILQRNREQLEAAKKDLATAKDQNTEMVHQILASQGKHADGAAATVSLEHECVYAGMDMEESMGTEATQGPPHSPSTGDGGSGQQTTFAHTDMAKEDTDQGAQAKKAPPKAPPKAPSNPPDAREERFALLKVGFDYLSLQDLQKIFRTDQGYATQKEFCKETVHRELQGQPHLGPCYTTLCAAGKTFPEDCNLGGLSESEFLEVFGNGDGVSTVQNLHDILTAYAKGTEAGDRAFHIMQTIWRLLYGVAEQCYKSRDQSQVLTQTTVVLLTQQRNFVTITNKHKEQNKVSKVYRVDQFSPLCPIFKGTRNLLTMVVKCDVAEDVSTLQTANNQKNDMFNMYEVWSGKSSAIDSLAFSGKYANELKPWQKLISLIVTSCAFAK